MRSMFRSALVALVAVLAVGVVASASASAALPEFQKGGKGLSNTVKFKATARGGIIESKSGVGGPACTYSVTGEITSPKEVSNIFIRGTKCRINLKPIIQEEVCTGPGLKEGEIAFAALSGRIGYLAGKTVGLLLEPTGGGLIEECKVGKEGVYKLRGSVIGKIKPLNEETTELTLVFQKGIGRGEQLPTHFEGEEAVHSLESAVNLLNHGQFEKTAIEDTFSISSEEAIEVKA